MKVLFRKDAQIVVFALLYFLSLGLGVKQPGALLNNVRDFFKDPWFDRSNIPFSLVSGIESAVVQLVSWVSRQTRFNPSTTLFSVGGVTVTHIVFPIILALAAVAIVFLLYRRALASENHWDDFLVLFVVLIALEIISESLALVKWTFFREGWVKSIVILIFLAASIFFGRKGFSDRLDVFLRAIGTIFVYAFILWPKEAASTIVYLGNILETVGIQLSKPGPLVGMVILVGLYLIKQWTDHQGRPARA